MPNTATKSHLEFNKLITPIIRSHVDYARKFSHSYSKTNTTKFWLYSNSEPYDSAGLEDHLTDVMRNIVGFKRVVVVTCRPARHRSGRSIYVYSDAGEVNRHYGTN